MNPYETLPSKAFWKPAVGNLSMFDIAELWDPKFEILPSHKVVSFGSCFAQHIGHSLKNRGMNWFITERAPHGLKEEARRKYNYHDFSARTGNIYTTSLLKQWTNWALNHAEVPGEVWEQEGRFYDPFRPNIEPYGFENKLEVKKSLAQAIKSFGRCIKEADFFVFTLGLTESWFNQDLGYEYPMCPGTVAGEFFHEKYKFDNQSFSAVISNLREAILLMREVNPELKFILTVSPIPLTATNSNNHVLVATMESKSILRAAAGELTNTLTDVDYFPSYEIISSSVFKGAFFEPNLRKVNPHGVNFVMDHFFNCLVDKFGERELINPPPKVTNSKETCEEELLEAFGGK